VNLVVPARARRERFADGNGGVWTLANPISEDMKAMRPSLLPGLLAAFARNLDRGAPGCACSRSAAAICAAKVVRATTSQLGRGLAGEKDFARLGARASAPASTLSTPRPKLGTPR
jgi:phenylalanyl-tRNA synthetase beta subunit